MKITVSIELSQKRPLFDLLWKIGNKGLFQKAIWPIFRSCTSPLFRVFTLPFISDLVERNPWHRPFSFLAISLTRKVVRKSAPINTCILEIIAVQVWALTKEIKTWDICGNRGQKISELFITVYCLTEDLTEYLINPWGCTLSEFADSLFYSVKSPCRAIWY